MTDMKQDDAPDYLAKRADTRAEDSPRGEGTVWGRTITVDRPRDELYAFWRDFSNLPRVMENVEAVTILDARRSRWRVSGPNGAYEWESVVTEDEPGAVIAWESAPDADVRNSGRVEFVDAPPGRGTWVRAVMAYDAPMGFIGKAVAALTQKEPQIQSSRDLRRFKMLMETGEIATSSPPNPPTDS